MAPPAPPSSTSARFKWPKTERTASFTRTLPFQGLPSFLRGGPSSSSNTSSSSSTCTSTTTATSASPPIPIPIPIPSSLSIPTNVIPSTPVSPISPCHDASDITLTEAPPLEPSSSLTADDNANLHRVPSFGALSSVAEVHAGLPPPVDPEPESPVDPAPPAATPDPVPRNPPPAATTPPPRRFLGGRKKIAQFVVGFDNNRTIFMPGQRVEGHVSLSLNEPIVVRILRLRFAGTVMTRTSKNENSISAATTTTVIFKELSTVLGAPGEDERIQLEAGEHVYPFTFRVPLSNLPASFDGNFGRIRYEVTAILARPQSNLKTASAYLTIPSTTNASDPEFRDPRTVSLSIPVGLW
ncbi:hypothetical protein HDU96_004406, partial [Phlyctochytrium bullatum]